MGGEKRKIRKIFVQKNDLTAGKKTVPKKREKVITNSNIISPGFVIDIENPLCYNGPCSAVCRANIR